MTIKVGDKVRVRENFWKIKAKNPAINADTAMYEFAGKEIVISEIEPDAYMGSDGWWWDENWLEVQCVCDLNVLMTAGCQCGCFQREKR